jgi:hypothetical protein
MAGLTMVVSPLIVGRQVSRIQGGVGDEGWLVS